MVSITSQGGKNKVKVYIIVDHGDSIGAEMGQTFPSSLFKTFLLFGLTEASFLFFPVTVSCQMFWRASQRGRTSHEKALICETYDF